MLSRGAKGQHMGPDVHCGILAVNRELGVGDVEACHLSRFDWRGRFRCGGSDNYAIELNIDLLNESDRGDWLIYVGGCDALADSIWFSGKDVGKLCDGKKAKAFADKETDARRDVSRRVSCGLGREDNGKKRRSFSHLHVQTRDWRKE